MMNEEYLRGFRDGQLKMRQRAIELFAQYKETDPLTILTVLEILAACLPILPAKDTAP